MRDLDIKRRPRGSQPARALTIPEWSTDIAYAIGVITSDGNLSKDGRHLSVVSKDIQLIETLRRCLGLQNVFRGCVDGDGSISTSSDPYHAGKNALLGKSSVSRVGTLRTSSPGVTGGISADRHGVRSIKYAKRESMILLRWTSYAQDVRAWSESDATAWRSSNARRSRDGSHTSGAKAARM